jgi:PAS domain S-box-containing protein
MVRNEAADPDYLVATIQNITPQKRLENELTLRNRELTETTVELHNMLESSTLYSIVSMDLDRTIRSWNAGAQRNYGYTAEEMVHRANISILHTPEDNANGRVEDLFATAFQNGTAEGVFERTRKDGQRFTASVSVTLRRDSTGSPLGYLLISKDVTEQKLLEHELTCMNQELAEQNRRVEEANRLKSQFLANMSHELRTPLNAIIGFSEIMHDEKVGRISEDHKEFLGDILTSAKHLLQLINDVLDLAKIESGKMHFDPEPVQLNRIVNEVRDVLRTMASRKDIGVAIEVDPSLDNIVADASKLKQVLYNYLSNALKFTPDGGHVTVRAMPEGPAHYRLEVEDTGIGVEPENLDRLFTEFRQLDTGASKQYQGTGLGLALTKRIVEAQGGSVDVASIPGHGSTFSAVLPRIMQGSDAQPSMVLHAALPQSAASVLVIEDDPSYSGWVASFLEEHGYRVTLARDGFEGIENCSAARFDAILLDILLPGLDGWETLRAIRRHGLNRDTPVIVVSITRPADAAADYPIQDFLTKPVNGESLLRSLAEVRRGDGRSNEILVLDAAPDAIAGIECALRANGYRPVRTPLQGDAANARDSSMPVGASSV